MSLEAAIAENTKAQLLVAEKLSILLSSAKAVVQEDAAAAGDTGKKTRKTKAKAADNDDDGNGDTGADGNELDAATVGADAKAWVFEFKANEKDPETAARGNAFKEALGKLGATKTAEVKADDLPRVVAWLEKQKVKGRLTGPLKADEDEDEGGEDDI